MSLVQDSRLRFKFQFEGKREVLDEERARYLLTPLFDQFVVLNSDLPDEVGQEVPPLDEADVSFTAVEGNDAREEEEVLDDEDEANLEEITSQIDGQQLQTHDVDETETAVVESIKLSGKSLTVPAAHVVAQLIKALPRGLKYADVSDIIASQPTEDALQTLRIIADALCEHAQQLVSLDLSDNAVGQNGVKAVKSLLRLVRHTVKELLFNNDGMSAAACEQLADELLESGAASESKLGGGVTLKLNKFHIYNNLSENEGAKHIARILKASPEIKDIRISSTRIRGEGGVVLAKSLEHANLLEKVDFSDNAFQPDFGVILSLGMRNQIHLRDLNLSSVGIDTNAVKSLVESLLVSNCPLRTLVLSSNELDSSVAESIVKIIRSKRTLYLLDLEENELGDDGACEILQCIGENSDEASHACDSIQVLNLSQNELTAGSVDEICDMIERMKGRLQKLELNTNTISSSGVLKIKNKLELLGNPSILGSMDDNIDDADE
jgi:large subunit ribosomal protein L31/Ran GTPase-activating protein 1